jgi:mannopine transport system permease protein
MSAPHPPGSATPIPAPRAPLVPEAAGRLLVHAIAWAVVVFLMIPTVIVIPMSFSPERHLAFPPTGFTLRWYGEYFADRDWIEATWFSARAGVLSAIAATLVGVAAAYALVRGTLPGRRLIELLIVGPIVVPHIALAVALFLVYEKLRLNGTVVGFVLAHTVLAVPFSIFTVLASLQRVDPDLEMAALSCGASRWSAFRHVTLPLILPGVLSGALFAFVISFDEAVVSFFISGLDGKSLPRKLWEDIDYNLSPVITAVASMLTLLSIAVLVGGHLIGTLSERRRRAAADTAARVGEGAAR